MLPPDWLAEKLSGGRCPLVLHLACKDLNRNGLESAAWRYAAEGCVNILALTGDYSTVGHRGSPKPVFDLDSVGLISLLTAMNNGLPIPGRRGKTEFLPKTDFYTGGVVSPFKRHERELLPQYFKLLRKIEAGAQWIIPQLGYDMRKFNEIKLWLAANGLDTPVIGNVYVLTKFVTKLFHSGKLAGCVVSDELLAQAEKYGAGEDRGRAFFRELAAKQLAVFKGLGFEAGYLGGIAKPETFFEIIDMAESFGENDWRDFMKEIRFSLPDEFFLFEHDPETGLSSPDAMNKEYLASLKRGVRSRHNTLTYRLSRLVHRLAFKRGKGLFPAMEKVYRRIDTPHEPGMLYRMAHLIERSSKRALYGCHDCGDCSLPDIAYLCPNASCSKNQRNGPCGGSRDGRCERDDKDCIWARAYERLKAHSEAEGVLPDEVVVHNPELDGTSAWANLYLGRDHSAPKGDAEDGAS